MEIVSFFLFCLGTVGFTHIIVDGSIFEWLRETPNWIKEKIEWLEKKFKLPTWILSFPKWLLDKLTSLLHCYQCSGFWCGFITGVFVFHNLSLLQNFVVAGCAGSFLSSWAAIYLNTLEANGTYFATKSIMNFSEDKDEEK